MKITVLNPDEFDLLVKKQVGFEEERLTLEGVADLVRSQSLALGPVARRVLVDTVERLLRPSVEADRDVLLQAVGRLQETGDLLVGERGKVGPAPVRAVRLTDRAFLVLGALPTDDARARLAAEIEINGVVRRAVVEPGEVEAFEAAVQASSGVVLDLDRYSGLDRHFPAGDHWLDELGSRAGVSPKNTAVEPSAMQVYRPATGQPIQGRRWRRTSDWPSQGLVRWRREGGWHEYAWVVSEADAMVVGLSKDEALRTMFSLDLQHDCAVVAQVTRAEDRYVLEIDAVLPYAEYRALLGLMNRTTWQKWPVRYEGDRQCVAEACGMLEERLGVLRSGADEISNEEA